MERVLDQTMLGKQIEVVAAKLADRGLTMEKRLVLLRRQAELGDLRDALAKRARRVNERRVGTP
jgi:hypothetical protein